MRLTPRLLLAASLLASCALAVPARADITHYQDGRFCAGLVLGCSGNGPVALEQGETRVINVKGQNVNFCSAVTVGGAGVTVAVDGTKLIADGATAGTGQVDLRFTLAGDAVPGNRNVTLSNCVGANFTLVIGVLRNGDATAIAPIPDQSNLFTTVDLTVSGVNIANAGAKVASTTSIPASATVQAQVLASTATSATVRLTYSTALAKATGQLFLFDAANAGMCVPGVSTKILACYGGSIPFTINGPNVVESITFPNGSRVTPGSVLAIRVKLVRPASGTKSTTGITLAGSTGGEVVKWQVHPSAVFVAETGTAFSPTASLNSVRFSTGTQTTDLLVRLQQVPAGCVTTCAATVEARTEDYREAAPFRRTAGFTIAFQ
ncbi:MAG TPA: hypothetical protein VFS59_14795 [Gemmatimonadaceae bacterium]|nr:hypothetical protein [Gemmatimonadaceae bacterium]